MTEFEPTSHSPDSIVGASLEVSKLHIWLGFALIAAFVFGFLIQNGFNTASGSFPELSSGRYVGAINIGKSAKTFFAEQTEYGLLLLVLEEGYVPVSLGRHVGPVGLRSGSDVLQLVGSGKAGSYSGEAYLLNSKERGSWFLASHQEKLMPKDSADFESWLRYRSELDASMIKFDQLNKESAYITTEVTRLSELVTDSTQLKIKAEEKLEGSRGQLESILAEYKKEREIGDSLRNKIEVAASSDGYGKLVKLEREISERERSWRARQFVAHKPLIELAMKDSDLLSKLERADRIYWLREQLAEARGEAYRRGTER